VTAGGTTTESLVVEMCVPGAPVPKGRPRVAKGRAYTPDRTAQYETAIGWAARAAMRSRRPVESRVGVTIRVWGASPSADIDNIAKTVLDGMNGIVYVDDRKVDELHVYRHVSDGNPRVTVSVNGLTG
jgi:crossover junction endodeoxyribonuclease RusA